MTGWTRPALTLVAVAGLSSAVGLVMSRGRPAEARPPVVAAAPVVTPVRGGERVVYPEGSSPVLTADGAPPIVVRSLLRVDHAMSYGDHVWNETGAGQGHLRVRVDLAQQTVSVFRGGDEIGAAVILYGADDRPTPTGTFPILARARSHRSSLYDAPMPYMLRLTGDGVALHGSSVEKGYATHGCIGLPDGFARRLYDAARVGDLVTVVRA
jgi:lipoprotein-anchoring transpeptidase ErfK/SrfK